MNKVVANLKQDKSIFLEKYFHAEGFQKHVEGFLLLGKQQGNMNNYTLLLLELLETPGLVSFQ